MKSLLTNVDGLEPWDSHLSQFEYDELLAAFTNGEQVDVRCMATDGLFGYYDIVTITGFPINAICGSHLVAITELRAMFMRQFNDLHDIREDC